MVISRASAGTHAILRSVLVIHCERHALGTSPTPMQMRDAKQLQKKWKKRGNLSCRHPHVQHEYYYETPTGEMVCTTCGATVTFNDLEERRRIEKLSRAAIRNES